MYVYIVESCFHVVDLQVPKGSGGKPCSGHGVPQCEDDEGKSATCMCDKGWDGAACDCTKVGLIFTRFSACSCFHRPCYA